MRIIYLINYLKFLFNTVNEQIMIYFALNFNYFGFYIYLILFIPFKLNNNENIFFNFIKSIN